MIIISYNQTSRTETLNSYQRSLTFLSKVIERVVARQLWQHLDRHSMQHPFQSAHMPNHSVVTALLNVHNDIMMSLDTQDAVFLVLLELYVAFNTVDHTLRVLRLQEGIFLCGTVMACITSSSSGWNKRVVMGR